MKVRIGDYKRERDISIKIDKWDTYSMDHTLALIVHPMLIQLRDTTHGAPFIPFEDRPDHLMGTVPIREHGGIDEFHHDAWDWVLTEMIYAFESKLEDDFDKTDRDRISNGFRLFGKYYENLWD
jgi:hypothetical protein